MTNREKWDKTLSYLRFIGFAALIAALPLNNFVMSFASFWLVGAWLFQIITDLARKEKLSKRFSRFTSEKSAILLTSLYALPLIGLLWTSDFTYAAWDLRMKLPILFMPLLFFSLNPMSAREFRALFGIFISSLLFAVVWCLLIYWQINPKPYTDVRDISVFISHIRFSLLIVLGICITYYYAWKRPGGKLLSILLSVLFVYFLSVIGSVTGFIVLIAVIAWWLIDRILHSKTVIKIALTSLLIIAPVPIAWWMYKQARGYFAVEKLDSNLLEKYSPRGEEYEHNLSYPLVEKGHYVYNYIAPAELEEAWMERSEHHLDSADARGQVVRNTLIRYLASRGLRKDFDGVYQLSEDDIRAIEKGYANYGEENMNALRVRMDDILFEYSSYRIDGDPSGHSVFQRLEFWKTAWHIIKDNFWTGVGTGDVKAAYEAQYEKDNSKLDEAHRLRGHNQYLTMWVTYGIFGFLFFVLVVFYPLFKRARKDRLFIAFTIIAALSFLTEDTLETQAGVMFYAFFYLFLLLRMRAKSEK